VKGTSRGELPNRTVIAKPTWAFEPD